MGDAARLEKKGASGPGKLSLDHIIKERYPTFVDALRDLDDALSLLFLFANLPSTSTVPPKTIALCQRLCHEFQHYLITTSSLQKSFLSIKGIYYQATIQGQDILWLVPYKFVQRVTGDVDFRIMGTFVEFYTTLLGFVNFRLYTSVGLVYPPQFDSKRDEQGAELDAFTLEGKGVDEPATIESSSNGQLENGAEETRELDEETQKQIAGISNDGPASGSSSEPQNPINDEPTTNTLDAIDTFPPPAPDADTLLQPSSSTTEVGTLFTSFTFYISRECPRAPLEFLLRAFGCKRIGWDSVLGPGAFTHDEADPRITHQIVDRPPLPPSSMDASSIDNNGDMDMDGEQSTGMVERTVRPGYRVPGRTYVQPQWVWDSVNAVKCLRPDLYAPGATLPPHLSPWVKPSKGQYNPSAPLAEQEREGEAEMAEESGEDAIEEGGSDAEDDEEQAGVNGTNGVQLAVETEKEGDDVDDEHGMTVGVASDTDDEEANDDAFTGFDSSNTSPMGIEEEEAEDDDEDVEDEGEDILADHQTTTQHLHQRELEAEAAGLPYPDAATSSSSLIKADGTPLKSILKSTTASSTSSFAAKPADATATTRKRAAGKQRQEKERAKEDEELERRKMMLGTRKRKLVEKMLFANRKRDGEAEKLRGKRRKIERKKEGRGGGGSGGGGLGMA